MTDVFCTEHTLFQRVMAPGRMTTRPFGCGSSGMNQQAVEDFAKIFSWDYMGAAEFEDGEAANCLQEMNINHAHLVKTEHAGFFFLTYRMTEQSHKLWDWLLEQKTPYHNPQFNNPEILGWFDFKNCFFVSRTAEMRDALAALFTEEEQ